MQFGFDTVVQLSQPHEFHGTDKTRQITWIPDTPRADDCKSKTTPVLCVAGLAGSHPSGMVPGTLKVTAGGGVDGGAAMVSQLHTPAMVGQHHNHHRPYAWDAHLSLGGVSGGQLCVTEYCASVCKV